MPIPFLTPIDLTGNEVLNMVLQNLPSPPSNPKKGSLYFNTTENAPMAYDGTKWVDLSFLGEFIEKSTVTAKGDLIVGTANKAVARLAKGTDGKVLTADSSKATGLDWKNPGDMTPGAHASTHMPGGSDAIPMLTNATADATPNTLVKRDSEGLFDVGNIDQDAADAIWKYMFDVPLTPTEESQYDNYKAVATNADIVARSLKKLFLNLCERIENHLSANDAMIFKGTISCSTNPNYPAADAGHTYRVSSAGHIGGASGPAVEIGDMLICLEDDTAAGTHADVGSKWTIVQANIDGAVTGPASAVSNNFAVFDGTSGKTIKDSGFAVATGTPKADAATGAVGTASRLAREDHVHPFATQPVNKGGTGLTSYAQGDLLYASAATTIAKLAKSATAGQVLMNSGADNNPAWAKLKYSELDSIPTSFTPASHGLASSVHTATAWRLFYSGANGVISELALGAANTVLRSGGTGAAPTFGSVSYSELSNVPTTFAPASHVLATATGLGPAHTISGATAGHVLVATGATAAKFAQLQWTDIGGKPTLDNYANWKIKVGATTTSVTSGLTLELAATGAASIAQSGNTITITATDTLYTAGNGIALSSGKFSVAAGAGLTQEASGLKLGTPGTVTPTSTNTAGAGTHTHALQLPVTKYAVDLDTSKTEYTITHNLNTKDVIVSIYENATGQQVFTDIEVATVNTVKVSFAVAPASDAYRVVVISG